MTEAPAAAARWIAAVICIVYGFAKINGSQFTVLDSEISKPLGDVSGFWLTWYYFGYSPIYGNMLALLQIAAGVLLVIPRTALAGALLLLPVVTNIVLIDVFYGVDLGGTVAAIVLLLLVIAILTPYIDRLRAAILLNTLPGRPSRRSTVALALVIAGAFGFTWWVANFNNRAPTEIDGVWAVRSQTPPVNGREWRQVFFERNRAHLTVFRAVTGADEQHHFEIDQSGTVRIWEHWLTKGSLIMEGRRTSGSEIELVIKNEPGSRRLVLQQTQRR